MKHKEKWENKKRNQGKEMKHQDGKGSGEGHCDKKESHEYPGGAKGY